jgi:hypothetical protein
MIMCICVHNQHTPTSYTQEYDLYSCCVCVCVFAISDKYSMGLCLSFAVFQYNVSETGYFSFIRFKIPAVTVQ